MLRFRRYLMENETAIKAAKSIASAVSGFDIEDTSDTANAVCPYCGK